MLQAFDFQPRGVDGTSVRMDELKPQGIHSRRGIETTLPDDRGGQATRFSPLASNLSPANASQRQASSLRSVKE